jgi:hypothetical protein
VACRKASNLLKQQKAQASNLASQPAMHAAAACQAMNFRSAAHIVDSACCLIGYSKPLLTEIDGCFPSAAPIPASSSPSSGSVPEAGSSITYIHAYAESDLWLKRDKEGARVELPLAERMAVKSDRQRVTELRQVQVPGLCPATAAGHVKMIVNQLIAMAAVSEVTGCGVAC